MNLEVQWCAYFFMEQKILTSELCHEIDEMFKGDCELQTFAQTVLDNGLCSDMELVQDTMDRAFSEAKKALPPPLNYFEDPKSEGRKPPKADTAYEEMVLADYEGMAFSGNAESISKNLDPDHLQKISESASWNNLPKLSNAEDISDEAAKKRMVQLLISLRELNVSDLHLSANALPFARVNRKIQKFGSSPLSAKAAKKLNTVLLSDSQKEKFQESGDLDYALGFDNSNRFRVNLMMHKEGVAGTYRIVPNKVKTLEDLGFANAGIINKLLDYHNGLILVTGSVGSGKTTTLAALVNAINKKRYDHVITVEDPIEIVQTSMNCNVTQRQVGKHTNSFASALKGALREDPDIIVIGELRDLETIEMAITASETGHLVIGTLHTSDAGSTLNRLLDVFPPVQQQQIRSMTAESLKGIICQKLIPTVDGTMAIAVEMLINNFAIASNIRDNKTHQIKQIIETGSKKGMCTMDQSVFSLYERGRISEENALAHLTDNTFINRIKGKNLSQSLTDGGAKKEKESNPKKKGLFR